MEEICNIWNCTVKVKSEFSGLHMGEMAMQRFVSFYIKLNVLVIC